MVFCDWSERTIIKHSSGFWITFHFNNYIFLKENNISGKNNITDLEHAKNATLCLSLITYGNNFVIKAIIILHVFCVTYHHVPNYKITTLFPFICTSTWRKTHVIPAQKPTTIGPNENIAKTCFCSHYLIFL